MHARAGRLPLRVVVADATNAFLAISSKTSRSVHATHPIKASEPRDEIDKRFFHGSEVGIHARTRRGGSSAALVPLEVARLVNIWP